MNKRLDALNSKIVAALQKNARTSFAALGRTIGLTPPAVAERVKKLEDTGVLLKYDTKVAYSKMGYQFKAMITLRAFVGKLKPFLEVVKTYSEVINCYRITGNENIMMEVVLRDQVHLEKFIDTLIQYGETRTHIILSEVVSSAPLKEL